MPRPPQIGPQQSRVYSRASVHGAVYAVTSYSGQGQTADRVLIHVDRELPAKDLINSRMAFVAVSCGAEQVPNSPGVSAKGSKAARYTGPASEGPQCEL